MPNSAAQAARALQAGRGRALALATLVAIVTIGLVHAVDGASAARKANVLGATKRTPSPLCPKDCRATGSVTGFPIRADGQRHPYRVRRTGHIVAWAVELSKPTKQQLNGFGEIFRSKKFGSDPQARISILKKKGKKKSRYKLAKSSPVVPLSGSLGEKPIYTLDNPLRVKRGRIVALTLPTWAPLYRDGLNVNENAWKASRKSGSCAAEDVPDAKPQMRKGSVRSYGCRLTGERILYWAYFVSKRKKGKN